jgi:hypothetical protein
MLIINFNKQVKWIITFSIVGFVIGLSYYSWFNHWFNNLDEVYICDFQESKGIGFKNYNQKQDYLYFLKDKEGYIRFVSNDLNKSDQFYLIKEKDGFTQLFVVKGPNMARQSAVKVWVRSDFVQITKCE